MIGVLVSGVNSRLFDLITDLIRTHKGCGPDCLCWDLKPILKLNSWKIFRTAQEEPYDFADQVGEPRPAEPGESTP